MLAPEGVRKAVHIFGGLLAPGFLWLFGWAGSVALAAFLLSYLVLAIDGGRHGIRLPVAWAAFEGSRRPGETYPEGALEYLVAILVLGVLFPLPYFLGAIALLAVGDGVASLAGRRWGRRRLPWNPSKSWAGLAVGVLVGLPAYVGFAVLGGILQREGYGAGRALWPGPPLVPVALFLLIGWVVVHAAARFGSRLAGSRPRARARPLRVLAAFGVAAAPCLAILLVLPAWFAGPLLPPLGGHGPVGRTVLLAAPLAAMLVESGLRRHDNLAVPAVAAALAYVLLWLVGPGR